jgi:hypothetical protein
MPFQTLADWLTREVGPDSSREAPPFLAVPGQERLHPRQESSTALSLFPDEQRLSIIESNAHMRGSSRIDPSIRRCQVDRIAFFDIVKSTGASHRCAGGARDRTEDRVRHLDTSRPNAPCGPAFQADSELRPTQPDSEATVAAYKSLAHFERGLRWTKTTDTVNVGRAPRRLSAPRC